MVSRRALQQRRIKLNFLYWKIDLISTFLPNACKLFCPEKCFLCSGQDTTNARRAIRSSLPRKFLGLLSNLLCDPPYPAINVFKLYKLDQIRRVKHVFDQKTHTMINTVDAMLMSEINYS